VGGVPLNFGGGFKRGNGSWVVMEGDEYDSAFFDKGPKFLHYRPQIAVVTSVEFDHADIYRDLSHVKGAFQQLVDIVPPAGCLLVCGDYGDALDLAQRAGCSVSTYGLRNPAEWQAIDIVVREATTSFTPTYKGRNEGTVRVPLIGRHNVANALAVYAIARRIGLSHSVIARAMELFRGVKRRQELIENVSGITVLDDFAHHPTAVRDTVKAVREAYPGRRLWAIFEPRSQTSRRRVFLKEFAGSLGMADRVIVADLYEAEKIPPDQRLSPLELAAAINAGNRQAGASHLPSVAEIVRTVCDEAETGDVILIMSNGSFGGLPGRLAQALQARSH